MGKYRFNLLSYSGADSCAKAVLRPRGSAMRMWVAALSVLVMLFGATSCGSHRSAASSGSSKSSSAVKRGPGSVTISSRLAPETRELLAEVQKWLGTAYRYGGTSHSGVDCSGLTMKVFDNALHIKLPRNSARQQEYCRRIGKNEMIEGDLVFFATGGAKGVNHVGIYVGSGKMVHASGSRGVIVSDLSEKYYVRNYHSSGRVELYYAMIGGKRGKKRKGKDDEIMIAEPVDGDVLARAEEMKHTGPGKRTAELLAAAEAAARRSMEAAAREAASGGSAEQVLAAGAAAGAGTMVSAAGVTVKTDGGVTISREAMELTRRKVLDDVIEQKVDSIVSEYFD